MAEKQYGLIKPQKPSTRLSAFASETDSDDEPSKKKVAIDPSECQKRQARIIQQDALKEDPTIFQYDELYDDMSTSREEAKKAKSAEVQSSKYINRLLVAADKRKKEYESRIERQVQKEREAEGDKFKDKEVFVTASYRAKLEEMKKAEENDRREEYLENIGDVTKQSDLSGFYRHMYEQKLGPEKGESSKPFDSVTATKKKHEVPSSKRRTYRRHSVHDNSEEEADTKAESSEKLANDSGPSNKKSHLQSNLDADSDFSIDSDSDDASAPEGKNVLKPPNAAETILKKENGNKTERKLDENGKEKQDLGKSKTAETETKPEPENMKPVVKPSKPKIDPWKKRTVGDVYLAAVQRYYERKQMVGNKC